MGDASSEYDRRIDAALGTREPMDVLRETPSALQQMVREHDAGMLRQRPFEKKWTPNEILGHLADCELVFGCRLRMVLWRDRPILSGFDQDKWVVAQQQNDVDPRVHVERFAALRAINVPVWELALQGDMSRAGVHSERGEESLQEMLRKHAGHDLLHVDQLRRYIAAIVG